MNPHMESEPLVPDPGPDWNDADVFDDSDEYSDDCYDSDDSDDDSSEANEFMLSASAALDPPKLDPSHAVFGQLDGATTFALSAFLGFRHRNQTLAKRRLDATASGPSKRVRLDSPSSTVRDRADEDLPAEEAEAGRPLACPYFLLDPTAHRACLSRPDPQDIRELLLHVARRHRRPVACPRCGEAFAAAAACDAHLRTADCALADFRAEGVTEAQVRQLARLAAAGLPAAEAWFALWDVALPSERRPASPYVPAAAEPLVALVQSLRGFWARNGNVVLGEFLRIGGSTVGAGDLEALGAEVLDRLVGLLSDLYGWDATGDETASGAVAITNVVRQLSGRRCSA